MAINTKEDRMALAGLCLPWMTLPLATGTVDAKGRAAIAGLYGGNPFSTVSYTHADETTAIGRFPFLRS